MNLQDRLDILNYYCSKEQSGRTFSPDEYNQMAPMAEQQLFQKLFAKFEETKIFSDAMLPFKVFLGQEAFAGNPAIPPLMIDGNGYAVIPPDYAHYSAIGYKKVTNQPNCEPKISYRTIPPVNDQQFDAYKNASLKRATHKYPVCNFQNGYIRFAPKDLQYCNFIYLRYPVKCVYGYTVNLTNDSFTYDPTTSVESEFRTNEQFDIILIMLSAIGVNLQRQDLIQFSELSEQKEAVNRVK
jgi:hypothetical protein